MKVLITGATGFVGREVLRKLHGAGHTARVLVRTSYLDDAAALVRAGANNVVAADVESAVEDEEELVGVLVDMPYELALELDCLQMHVVDLTDNLFTLANLRNPRE